MKTSYKCISVDTGYDGHRKITSALVIKETKNGEFEGRDYGRLTAASVSRIETLIKNAHFDVGVDPETGIVEISRGE